jgi:O-antigen biosynthesis protein
MRDARYIRVRGRPLLIVYRPSLLPEPLETVRRWRTHFTRLGLGDPFLVMAQSFGDEDPRKFGFDAAVEFPPHKVGAQQEAMVCPFFDASYRARVYSYEKMVDYAIALPSPEYKLFRGVCPSWDNVARMRYGGTVFASASPDLYARWLEHACRTTLLTEEHSERMVFINAWNEWAEGTHLEPDRHFGYAYLRATARTLAKFVEPGDPIAFRRVAVVSHDACFYGAQMLALNIVRTLVRDYGVEVRVLLGGPGPLEQDFRELGPTQVVNGGFSDLENWRVIARELGAGGFTSVICSTTVAAHAIEALATAGLRVVLLVHEMAAVIREMGLFEAARTAARLANTVVFPATQVRDCFVGISGSISGNIVIRPQGLYMTPLSGAERDDKRRIARLLLKAAPTDIVILGVGCGDERKGFDLWSPLIRRVAARYPQALFVWVGAMVDRVRASVVAELDRLSLSHRLRLIAPTRSLEDIYAAADVFLLSSREDPFPNVLLEAMANGLPVAAFDRAGGFSDLVQQTGAPLARYLDLNSMENILHEYLADGGLRERIGKSGKEMIRKEFEFKRYVGDLLNLAAGFRPTVSVIIPNYNYARYLPQRVQSIWSQTYPVHEIIILDDASTDDSSAVLAELQRRSGKPLRVLRNSINSGSVWRQWARGVALASGELVWIAEADDFADSGFLAATIPAFADSRVVMSYSQSRQIDSDGNVLDENYLDWVADVDPHLWRADYCRPGAAEIAEALSIKNTIPNVSAVVFRRSALRGVLETHLEEIAAYRNAGDWICYVHVLKEGHVAFTATSLNNHRRHATSVTNSASDRQLVCEIAAAQNFAARAVPVNSIRRSVALRHRYAVAKQFGLQDMVQPEPAETAPEPNRSAPKSVEAIVLQEKRRARFAQGGG